MESQRDNLSEHSLPVEILDAIPKISEITDHARTEKWVQLGRQQELNDVDQKECKSCAHLYQLWLQEKGKHATRRTLLDALRALRQNAVADSYVAYLQNMVEDSTKPSQISTNNSIDQPDSDFSNTRDVQEMVTDCSYQSSHEHQVHAAFPIMKDDDESFNDRDDHKTEVFTNEAFTEESDDQVSLFDNQEAEITLKIRVKNTSGEVITLRKGGTIPSSLVYTIQAVSLIKKIPLAFSEEGEEEERNVAGGNSVEQQKLNVNYIDSMEYEECFQHGESDDDLKEDDSQEQWVHHIHDDEEQRQSKTDQNQGRQIRYTTPSPTFSEISKQDLSQIKEEQRKEKKVLLSMSKEKIIQKYEKVKKIAVVSDITKKEMKQELSIANRKSEEFEAIILRRMESDEQNEEEKKNKNKRKQIRSNRTKILKNYVEENLNGWEVIPSSIKHIPSNTFMKFTLKPSSDCTVPGSVSFKNDVTLEGTVRPANLTELKNLMK